ncbi:MAG TPA: phosphoribosylformylglycinamidine cyclo-ligase [Gammaproteobacteria bacterium]|nr:phosphoribosylformylglycinamidine cyclo-ligase [Gammaproteobacteria bacterium]
MNTLNQGLTYKDAGVDIDRGEALVDIIKPVAASTRRPGWLGNLGGFGALFEVPDGYQHPVLVSGTDGVGTKLKLAIECKQHEGIGIDLVAMCANDVLVQGAEPLFFLDYFATGKLESNIAAAVITSIGEGCRQAGAALIGGETAEMPGMYAEGDYDLAGFCVGVVEKHRLIDGLSITPGDTLIGLASSGPHANGYSLIRRTLQVSNARLDTPLDSRTLADALLTPTRIYVQSILKLLPSVQIHAMAHITGGGLPGNIKRVLPVGCKAILDSNCWHRPAIFDWLQQQGNIAEQEMLRTFNCGLGFVIVVHPNATEVTLDILRDAGEAAMVVGQIEPGTSEVVIH